MSSDESRLSQQELGYGFYDRIRPTSPGYAKLNVSLLDESGPSYFSPEYLRVSIINEQDKLEHLTIYHPWEDTESYRLGVDRAVLRDYKGRTIEVFTFGGTLEIVDMGSHTICSLSSPAPILELVEEFSITTLLAAEAEEILGAFWQNEDTVDFEQWVAQANPLKLYAAVINRIEQELLALSTPDVMQVQLLRIVSAEINALRTAEFHEGLPELSEVS